MAFRVTLVQGMATNSQALTRMVMEIEMSGDWFGCVLVISFSVSQVLTEAVA